MTGMSQTNCCCTVGNKCLDCNPDVQICCIQCNHDMWEISPVLLHPQFMQLYFSGDNCPLEDHTTTVTNLCGYVETTWSQCPGYIFDEVESPCRPPWDVTSHACMPRIRLHWSVTEDCEQVELWCEIVWWWSKKHVDSIETVFRSPKVTEDSDWYTRAVQFDDPLYAALNASDPVNWPGPVPKISFQVCPEIFTEFPEPDERVILHSQLQARYDEEDPWVDFPGFTGLTGSGASRGNTVCGFTGTCKTKGSAPEWRYDPYLDKVRIWVKSALGSSSEDYVEVDYDGGAWYENTIYLPISSLQRWKLTQTDTCSPTTGPTPVPEPPLYCFARKLCIQLEVADGSYQYYTVNWNGTTKEYHLEEVLVPGPSGCSIEILIVEDPDLAEIGFRAWVLTVTIRDSMGGTVILDYSETLQLLCTAKWTRTSYLDVPLDPEERWTLKISTNCPDPPEPPACDPGCWPECVMCPTRKSLAIVIDDYPSCCLNSYTLTYDSGTDTYYLPSPVGGPLYTCGWIMTAVVSCVGSSSIHLVIQFKDSDGTLKGSDSVTLTAVCDGEGNMETTTPFEINGSSLICGDNVFTGGRLRVVTI